jgi:4-hydroxy-tetrahydrodipicolinate synthase
MTRKLEGMLSAMATPFTADGAHIDTDALAELVEGTIAAGVEGLIPAGSTGEFPSLSVDERKQLTELVARQANGRVLLVPHTGHTSTATAIDLSRHAESVGADAVMVVHPYYEPMSEDEVFAYFEDISNAISIPIMVYNIPSCTGVNLRPAFLARLGREIEHVQYVKDSSGDLSQLQELLYHHSDDVTTFNGWDTLTFSGLELGSKGSVWGAVNVAPRQCAELFDLVHDGKMQEARALWDRLWPIMYFLTTEGYNASVKAGAQLAGFRVGSPRRPQLPLAPEKTERLRQLMLAAGAIGELVAA